MPFGVKMNVSGVDTTLAGLDEFKASVQRSITRQALRSSVGPLRKAVKAGAPVESGALKKSIGVTKLKTTRRGNINIKVGPRDGFDIQYQGKKRNPVKYAHLVELGTSKGVKPTHWMREARKASEPEVLAKFADKMRQLIDRYRARRAAKAARKLAGV